jgi:adenylate cyclase, class 2
LRFLCYCFDKADHICNCSSGMDHLEIELKFFFPHFNRLRDQLVDAGAVCTVQRTFEHNVRYETEDDRLKKSRCLLRLRKDRRITLTYKSPPPETDDRFKIYRELEVVVDDFDTMDAILQSLGFVPRQVYEKWRETWQLNETTLCLDTLPFGHFLEIEGSPPAIMRLVRDLGLRWHQRILTNYLGLFATLRQKEGWSFSDVTFANFESLDIRFDRYRHLFEAGHRSSI